jgi:hypothetical protein
MRLRMLLQEGKLEDVRREVFEKGLSGMIDCGEV